MRITPEQLDEAALADILTDARVSREQAELGPYYPEREITRESLLKHAIKCEAFAERYKLGGAHNAILKGEV